MTAAPAPVTWMRRLGPVLVLLLALIAFLPGLDRLPVTDRDEARYAQASRQMAASGDWIDIRFQDAPRYKKPVGIYWAQAAAVRAAGPDRAGEIWVYRLPSFAAAALACLALIWAGRPLVGGPAAIIAGAMAACLFLLNVEARIAKTDAALHLATILAMGALARAWLGQIRGWGVPLIFWTALGVGVLIKGPLVLPPVLGAILTIGVFIRRLGWLTALRPLPGLAWALLLALPWYLAILWISDGQFLAASLGEDLTAKVAAGQESHGAPPGSYLLTFWLTFWPWTLLVPLAAPMVWARRSTPEMLFLLGWAIPGWVMLEAVPTKLLHYPLPLYPALVLIVAAAALALLRGERRLAGVAGVLGAGLWALVALLLAGVIVALPLVAGPGLSLAASAGALAGLALGALGLAWLFRGHAARGLAAIGGAALVTFWTLVAVALPGARDLWISDRLAEATARHACLRGPMILGGYTEPSAVFGLGTDTRLARPEEALAILAQTPGAVAWIDISRLDEDLDALPPGQPGETEIAGFNYSRGKPVTLRLFRAPGVPATVPVCPPPAE